MTSSANLKPDFGRHSKPSLKASVSRRQSLSKKHSLMKKKGAPRESESVYLDNLAVIDLNKFCPHKVFNVLFINETDDYSNKFLKKLIESSSEFEEISYLTFITYEEVLSLLENYENAALPPVIKNILIDMSRLGKDRWYDNSGYIRPSVLASLMKLKLIEVMYKQYTSEVLRMERRKKLENDLYILTRECMGGKEKPSKKSESKLAPPKVVENVVITDYTTIPIETQDDIIFDDDIHHHIAFYVFQGFYSPKLLKEVIVNNFVNIASVLRFTVRPTEKKSIQDSSMFSDFWEQIDQQFYGPKRCMYFENTFLMTYTAATQDLNEVFEELLDVFRSVSDIKLNHLNYIRHMEILRVKEVYHYIPLECFNVYNNFLDKIPPELVKIPVLLDTLLKQIPVNVEDIVSYSQNWSIQSYLDLKTFESNRCSDNVDNFFKNKSKNGLISTFKNRTPNFLVHENDEITLILNSYKKHGLLVYDLTKLILRNQWPLKGFSELDVDYTDVLHMHDIEPESKMVIEYKDSLLHFLYLFLFYMFDDPHVLPKPIETKLTKNLETNSRSHFFEHCQPKVFTVTEDDEGGDIPSSNLYNVKPGDYFWTEKLDSTVLPQEIFKAENEYLYCDQKYSPETDTLLIQFSNRLNDFGLNTKVHEECLLTPVCLRDFCKYTAVEQADWLEENKPAKYTRKCFVKEACPGATKVIENTLYPEYTDLIQVIHPEKSNNNNTNAEGDITFEQLLDEIKNYPSSFNIYRECVRSEKPNKFVVFDFGTKYLQISGHITTFYSHDGVKLTVDNTRMLNEYPKCSINLECRNNSLVLHSNKFYISEDYNFHMNLVDGTILSVIFVKPSKKYKSTIRDKPESMECEEEEGGYEEKIVEPSDFRAYTETVLSVDQNYFESLMESKISKEQYLSSTDITFKPPESMLERLKEAVSCNVPIYKVSKNFSHLKKLKSQFEIPLITIVKRILHNSVQKEENYFFTKRFVAENSQKPPQPEAKFDTRIAYPNGLYISLYPSKVKEDHLEVKQEYLCYNEQTELEEFRLFTRGGYILIKRVDGSITILKSNGDTIDHEKPATDSEDVNMWRLRPCHRKNINDYKKRVSKLFKNQNEDMAFAAASRRAFYQTRKGYVTDPNVISLLENSKLPYLKSSMLKFDGSRVSIESGKLKIKKVFHTTLQKDFDKQEMLYERGDGLTSIICRNGSQSVQFADGTKITSYIQVEEQLVDGYVYISMEFEYSHPSYAAVNYTFDGTLKVVVNDNVVFTREPDNIRVNIDDDIVTTIDKDNVYFEKTCLECSSKYTCDINILPLTERRLAFSEEFVHACDSYNKHFYSDFAGNCKRNTDFIRGERNVSNCNHFLKMSYKSLFVVNRDLSGSRFWTDQMVMAKRQAAKKDEYNVVNDSKDPANMKIQVLKFTRNYYNHYINRFLFLPKMPDSAPEPVYSTFCLIKRMLDYESLMKFCQDLRCYFEKSGGFGTKLLDTLTTVFEDSEVYCQRVEEIFPKKISVGGEKCKCAKKKITIADKIEKWRRECQKYKALLRSKEIPCYFKSDFCQTIKRN